MRKFQINVKYFEKILKDKGILMPNGLSNEQKRQFIINSIHNENKKLSKELEKNIGHEPVELTLDN